MNEATKIVLETVRPHLAWLWLWFMIGTFVYMMKRAYYLVTGPNPIANTYGQFFQRAWIPLFVRWVIDSVIFWSCFNPELLSRGLQTVGWTSLSGSVGMVTQFPPMSFFFGLGVDSIMDMAVSKIPGLKDFLPQMPGPLPRQPDKEA